MEGRRNESDSDIQWNIDHLEILQTEPVGDEIFRAR